MVTTSEPLPRRLGNYELTQRVGSGGMGVVYRAIDRRLNTAVAIKVIHPHLRAEPGYLERFRREAHVASLLTSPYLVHVIEFGFDDGDYYLATEYVEGTRLKEIIARGPLDAEQALSVAVQVALGLSEADVRGVIHRDIKPENVMLTNEGSVKLMDFGIARLSFTRGVTQPGLYVGTILYSAPEQFRGQVDIRGDIYSLGIMLFEMLSGALPFEGETIGDMIRMHEQSPPPLTKLRHLPPALVDVVAKCLEKNPAERYQHPSELLLALETARSSLPAARPNETWVSEAVTKLVALEEAAPQQPGTVVDRHQTWLETKIPPRSTQGSASGAAPAPFVPPAAPAPQQAPQPQWAAPASQQPAPYIYAPPVPAAPSRKSPSKFVLAGAAGAVLALAAAGFVAFAGGSDGGGEQAAVVAEASPTVEVPVETPPEPAPVVPAAPAALPDRNNCAQIRGTEYRSATEKTWFEANCNAPAVSVPAVSAPAVTVPSAPAPSVPNVPVPNLPAPSVPSVPSAPAPTTSGSFRTFGFSSSATSSNDPPANTVGSGSTLVACNPNSLYVWIDYSGLDVPASLTGRWLRGNSQINEFNFNQTAASGRMFFNVGSPLPPGTYSFRLLRSGSQVLEGNVTLSC